MPMRRPQLSPDLARNADVICAVAVLAIFTLGHFIAYEPIARRYQIAATRAAALGLSLDPSPRPAVSQRVATLLAANVLPAAEASRRSESGQLTSALLGDLATAAHRHGLRILNTEPGPVDQLASSAVAKAHVNMTGTYAEFIDFLGDLARGGSLIAIDRFSLTIGDGGRHRVDVWASRLTLKQSGAQP